jgi:hypothetical protein
MSAARTSTSADGTEGYGRLQQRYGLDGTGGLPPLPSRADSAQFKAAGVVTIRREERLAGDIAAGNHPITVVMRFLALRSKTNKAEAVLRAG